MDLMLRLENRGYQEENWKASKVSGVCAGKRVGLGTAEGMVRTEAKCLRTEFSNTLGCVRFDLIGARARSFLAVAAFLSTFHSEFRRPLCQLTAMRTSSSRDGRERVQASGMGQ